MNYLKRNITNFIKKIMFHIKLIKMDLIWGLGYRNCFNPFPPSFYYTHTDEEIEQIFNDMQNSLRALIEEIQTETCFVSGNEEDTSQLEGRLENNTIQKRNANMHQKNDGNCNKLKTIIAWIYQKVRRVIEYMK